MGHCNGNCGACSGCARELVLSPQEIDFLRELGQYAFLPVARELGDLTPVYPEAEAPEQMSLLLQVLEKKGLIARAYATPWAGLARYENYPCRGSMALTQRGQQVLELMEYQGVNDIDS